MVYCRATLNCQLSSVCYSVADPEGGLGGLNPPSEVVLGFFCLSVYENSHGPGP